MILHGLGVGCIVSFWVGFSWGGFGWHVQNRVFCTGLSRRHGLAWDEVEVTLDHVVDAHLTPC
jgi:hypothetical protein